MPLHHMVYCAVMELCEDHDPMYQERGWTEELQADGSTWVYNGAYILTFAGVPRRFEGRILRSQSGGVAFAEFICPAREIFDVYICDPPPALKLHPEGCCFQLIKNSWFKVHYINPPRSVDEAIIHIECVLQKSFALAQERTEKEQLHIHGNIDSLLA